VSARKLRSVFFGSSEFAVPSLEALSERHELLAVVSQPDRPAGRKMALHATPVSRWARERHVNLYTPEKLDLTFGAQLAALGPELFAVASYGRILPRAVLEIPEKAALNVHPSMLPRYRGATPIRAALRDGCSSTGVTVFWMAQAMDAGDIALSRAVAIPASDNYETLELRLAVAGAELLVESAALLAEGLLPRIPQNENEATYTKPLTAADLELHCEQSATQVINHIRSLSPRPGAWLRYDGRRLKVLAARPCASADVAEGARLPAGSVFQAGGKTLIKTGDGVIEPTQVVLEGKPAMSGAQFAQTVARRSPAKLEGS